MDRVDARLFFETVFPDLEDRNDAFLEIRKLPSGHQSWCRSYEHAVAAAADATANVYFGVSLRDGKVGTEEHSKYLPGLWADIDLGSGSQQEVADRIAAFPLQPSVTLNSGRGCHAYWLFHEIFEVETEDEIRALREMIYGLSQAVEGDPSVRDLSRVLRVPGTKNLKDPNNPKDVKVVSFRPDLRYNPSDFDEWRMEEPSSSQNGTPLPEKIPDGERNQMLTSLAGSLRRRGLSADEMLPSMLKFNERCDPPLSHEELRSIAHSMERYAPDDESGLYRPVQIISGLSCFARTDLGNAERFVHRYGGELRYCYEIGSWFAWKGNRWIIDSGAVSQELAQRTVRAIRFEANAEPDNKGKAAVAKHGRASEASSKINAMLSQAQSMQPVLITDLDADRWILNVANGMLDLRRFSLLKHDRTRLSTKLAPVEYDMKAVCPRWLEFLNTIMCDRPELVDFLKKVIGYALTGDTSEQVFFILYGGGMNGKSTLLEVIRAFLGDYATHTPSRTLMEKRLDAIPNDIARLRGARFVDAVETKKGGRLDESLIKEMTGGDEVTARFLNQEFFQFRPQFKLFVASNNKPQIRGTDHAIWRRVRLIPFEYQVARNEVDKDLAERLKGELPGILTWAVEGCRQWQEEGLEPPGAVEAATRSYRTEQDVIGNFIEECCFVSPTTTVVVSDLYQAFVDWCDINGERPLAKRVFGIELNDRGFEDGKGTNGVRIRKGLELADAPRRKAINVVERAR